MCPFSSSHKVFSNNFLPMLSIYVLWAWHSLFKVRNQDLLTPLSTDFSSHSYQTCFFLLQVAPQMLSGWTWGTDSCWKCKSLSGAALTRLALRPATLWKLIRLIRLVITLLMLMMRSYMHLSDDGDDEAYYWSPVIWLSVLLIISPLSSQSALLSPRLMPI